MSKVGTSPRPAEKDKSVTPTPAEFVQDFRHIERQEGEVRRRGLQGPYLITMVVGNISLKNYVGY